MLKLCYLCSIFLSSLIISSSSETPTLTLAPETTITGRRNEDLGYDEFLGIPYAKPPIFEMRFRNPMEIPLWTGNFDAVNSNYRCWEIEDQFLLPIQDASEDCLYLNVYKPSLAKPGDNLTVIVFLHGGGFHSGNNQPEFYFPKYFLKSQVVIVVTLTYRLNVFGFFSIGDKQASGNYGLKDQTMAMKWVFFNIHAFGGNPERVTLMGHEAGAVAVNYHLMTNYSRGLFQRAILFSGSINAPWVQPKEEPIEDVYDLAERIGVDKPRELTNEWLIDSLKVVPAKKLIDALRGMSTLPRHVFLPCVEPESAMDPFLTEQPDLFMNQGTIHVPVLMSVVPLEGMRYAQPFLRNDVRQYLRTNSTFNQQMADLLMISRSHPKLSEIVKRIQDWYLGTESEIIRLKILKMFSDFYVRYPFFKTLKQMKKISEGEVFAHMMDYDGLRSFSRILSGSKSDFGVVHMDDLLYLFGFPRWFNRGTPADEEFARIYSTGIIRFAMNGDPKYNLPLTVPESQIIEYTNAEELHFRKVTDIPFLYNFWKEIEEMIMSDKE